MDSLCVNADGYPRMADNNRLSGRVWKGETSQVRGVYRHLIAIDVTHRSWGYNMAHASRVNVASTIVTVGRTGKFKNENTAQNKSLSAKKNKKNKKLRTSYEQEEKKKKN